MAGTGGASALTLKTLGNDLPAIVGLCEMFGLMVRRLLSSESGVPFSGVGDLRPASTTVVFFVGVLCLEKTAGTGGACSLTLFSDAFSVEDGAAFSKNCNFVKVISSSKSSSQLSVASSTSGTTIGLAGTGMGLASGKRFGMNGRPEAIPALELLERVGGEESFQVITVLMSPLGAGVGDGERTRAGLEEGGGFEGDLRASFHCCTRWTASSKP